MSYANSVDPDQSSNMRGLDSDKISQVCCLFSGNEYR